MRFISVERVNNELEREMFNFWYNDSHHTLVLSNWTKEARATTRHKFKVVESWAAYNRRIKSPAPTISASVKTEALRLFTETLTVGIVGER